VTRKKTVSISDGGGPFSRGDLEMTVGGNKGGASRIHESNKSPREGGDFFSLETLEVVT